MKTPVADKGDMTPVFDFLERRKGLLDAVVISGGEPTLQKKLVTFLSRIKSMGFLVKLDTNGSRPQVLRALLAEGFVDYVAMDIKASLGHYTPGITSQCDPKSLLTSIELIMDSAPDYEFRTTCVKPFITLESITEILQRIKGAKRYALQTYRPKKILDSAFFEDCDPGCDQTDLKTFQSLALTYVDDCLIR